MDPVPLLAALCGAAVAGLLAIGGAALQSRREHRRWLRERRYDAYTRMVSILNRLQTVEADFVMEKALADKNPSGTGKRAEIRSASAKYEERMLDTRDEFFDATASFELLGPKEVNDALTAVLNAMQTADGSRVENAERALKRVAQRALGVRD